MVALARLNNVYIQQSIITGIRFDWKKVILELKDNINILPYTTFTIQRYFNVGTWVILVSLNKVKKIDQFNHFLSF